MKQQKYKTIEELLSHTEELKGIHIECDAQTADAVFEVVRRDYPQAEVGYIIKSDKGYERMKVREYVKFWADLSGARSSVQAVMQQFGLTALASKTMRELSDGEQMLVQFARLSFQPAKICFLMEPILNLPSESVTAVLNWMEERIADGICFITTSASLRASLLMPGTTFFVENDAFLQVEQDEESDEACADDFQILKIQAKSENSTILFEPKDIDYIESLNKSNYVFVRGDEFCVSYTMDELERMLESSGFFRCHRSYIVNMQRVEQIEKTTKNSYSLILNDSLNTRIPLSKARAEQMKAIVNF